MHSSGSMRNLSIMRHSIHRTLLPLHLAQNRYVCYGRSWYAADPAYRLLILSSYPFHASIKTYDRLSGYSQVPQKREETYETQV